MDLLTLAFNLSVLTYFIGAMLKGAPIPLASLKKLGSRLMVDGIFSAALVFSYRALLFSISYFGSVLGADWAAFNQWFVRETTVLVSLISLLKLIGMGYNKLGLGYLASGFVSPLVNVLVNTLITLLTFYVAAHAIRHVAPILISTGIALHSVPFRLTRAAGSVMIAVAIVFSVGAPFLPNFISIFQQGTLSVGVQAAPGYAKAADLYGSAIAFYVLEGYDSSGNLLYRYASDSAGIVNATSQWKWFPTTAHTVALSLPGFKYTVEKAPTLAGNGTVEINLTVPGVVAVAINAFVYFYPSSVDVYSVQRSNGSVAIRLSCQNASEIYVVYQKGGSVNVLLDGRQPPTSPASLDWYGLGFEALIVDVQAGDHTLVIETSGLASSPPTVEEVGFVAHQLSSDDSFSALLSVASAAFFQFMVLPIAYVAMLVATSLALAKLLGGIDSKIARALVLAT